MSSSSEYPNEGYDEWLVAIAAGEGYYLECPNGHGSLPPRRLCPDCGSGDLSEVALPNAGEVETYTVTNVAAPSFEEDVPYAVAVVSFGDVAITGQLRNVDPESVDAGLVVQVDVDQAETTGDRVVVFRPR